LLVYYIVFSVLLVSILWICAGKEWNRRRYRFFDRMIKGRLRVLKEKNIAVKISFSLVQFLAPALLIISCLVPKDIPDYFSIFSAFLLFFLLIYRYVNIKWRVYMARIPLFLMIPFIIYLGEESVANWIQPEQLKLYNMSFVILVFFILMTLKFSQRQAFKSTPMDFLILFIALVVPNLPDKNIQSFHMGLVAAKIIAMFFSFEVLIGELRANFDNLVPYIMLALLAILIRGYFGI